MTVKNFFKKFFEDWRSQRRKRDLNPRAGITRPTPLAGGPLRPLEYFSTQLKKHLGALQSAYQIIYEASELCQPEFSLILSHFFAPPGPHKMGCREAQSHTLSCLKILFHFVKRFRYSAGQLKITSPYPDHSQPDLCLPELPSSRPHLRLPHSAGKIHEPLRYWRPGRWNPGRSS